MTWTMPRQKYERVIYDKMTKKEIEDMLYHGLQDKSRDPMNPRNDPFIKGLVDNIMKGYKDINKYKEVMEYGRQLDLPRPTLADNIDDYIYKIGTSL